MSLDVFVALYDGSVALLTNSLWSSLATAISCVND